jgi:hypothetical protein
MTKRMTDIDDEALAARRRDLARFAADMYADLRNPDIMSGTWQHAAALETHDPVDWHGPTT